jgi:hypothetical protein
VQVQRARLSHPMVAETGGALPAVCASAPRLPILRPKPASTASHRASPSPLAPHRRTCRRRARRRARVFAAQGLVRSRRAPPRRALHRTHSSSRDRSSRRARCSGHSTTADRRRDWSSVPRSARCRATAATRVSRWGPARRVRRCHPCTLPRALRVQSRACRRSALRCSSRARGRR